MVPGQTGRLSGGPGSVLISTTWREKLCSLAAGSPWSLGNPGPDVSQMQGQPDTLGRQPDTLGQQGFRRCIVLQRRVFLCFICCFIPEPP